MAEAADFLEAVRSFARQVVAQGAADWARGQPPAQSVWREAGRIGLTRIEVPVAHGGLGLGFRARLEACAIVAAVDFGLAMALVNTHNVALRIALSAPDAVARAVLPELVTGAAAACTALTEAGAGSDVTAMASTAQKVAGGWLLNGEKRWIVNARHARFAIVYAQTGAPGDAAGIAAFLVDLDDPSTTRFALESGISQVSIGTGGLRLDRCFVGDDRLLLPAGTAFKAILSEINTARLYVAAMCCAMVSAGLGLVQAYGETRQTFGRALGQHPAWREKLAGVAVRLAAAFALVEAAAGTLEQGGDIRQSAAAAKVNAVTLAQEALPGLLHAMGAAGLDEAYPFTRHIGSAQIAALTDGSTAMLLDRLGRWNPTPFAL